MGMRRETDLSNVVHGGGWWWLWTMERMKKRKREMLSWLSSVAGTSVTHFATCA